MYISLVLFKENIGIFNLGHVFHLNINISNHIKSTFMDVFQHYFADGLATLYSSVDLSSVFFLFSVFFRCSWSSAGLWARTSSRNSMRASIGTVLDSSSYFYQREGMLDSCWHRFHYRPMQVHTHYVLGIVFHRFCKNISQCYSVSCIIQSKHCLV